MSSLAHSAASQGRARQARQLSAWLLTRALPQVGSHVVARTQIPFYDIAAASAAAASTAAASAAAAASVAASAAISAPALSLGSLPGDALSCPSPPLSARGARQQEQPAAGKWSGRPLHINACCSTLASLAGLASSMPCTPRPTGKPGQPGGMSGGRPQAGPPVRCLSEPQAHHAVMCRGCLLCVCVSAPQRTPTDRHKVQARPRLASPTAARWCAAASRMLLPCWPPTST